jgi:methionine-rich copper-binding protein CopC
VVSSTVKAASILVARVVVGTALLVLAAPPAGAHTDFVRSDPTDGARLDEIPREVALEFSDDMDPQLSTVILSTERGHSTPLKVTNGARPTILVAELPAATDPADGGATRWTITFRVVSRDGHPVVGSTQFLVRAPSPDTSDARAGETAGGLAAGEPGTSTAGDRAAWPLVALGVGALLLVAGAVGAIMRLTGRGRDA